MKRINNSDVTGWHSLEIEPPDKIVEVEDKNGNRAMARPTYYSGAPWSESTYWDGGWIIQREGLTSNIDSQIVRWRACD